MMMVPERYTLLDHVNSDVASSTDLGWRRMDSVVLNRISNSITPKLHQVVRERGATARHLWLAIENQFLENREQRTLHLDAAFCNFVQGDLTVSKYCRKFKNMADALADLGSLVDDRILVLNIFRGLNPRFKHLFAIIRCYTPARPDSPAGVPAQGGLTDFGRATRGTGLHCRTACGPDFGFCASRGTDVLSRALRGLRGAATL
jgi:hypothetical protein